MQYNDTSADNPKDIANTFSLFFFFFFAECFNRNDVDVSENMATVITSICRLSDSEHSAEEVL